MLCSRSHPLFHLQIDAHSPSLSHFPKSVTFVTLHRGGGAVTFTVTFFNWGFGAQKFGQSLQRFGDSEGWSSSSHSHLQIVPNFGPIWTPENDLNVSSGRVNI